MNRQAIAVIAFVAVAGFAGAWALGLLSPARPAVTPDAEATAPPPAPPQPRDNSAPAARPAPATPSRPSTPRADVPVSPAPAEPAAPTTATLTITTDVPDAQVFVDNRYVGTAPAIARDVAPGQRKINVQAPGYESVAEFIDVTPGPREVTISLKTIRLDASVSVTHRHGVGSCQGTLVATPAGVRYDTSHRNDAFTVALTDIETFETDYLKGTLRLKIRGGRSYDFTDPSGKADALYLFHQEVDKVRKRLVK